MPPCGGEGLATAVAPASRSPGFAGRRPGDTCTRCAAWVAASRLFGKFCEEKVLRIDA